MKNLALITAVLTVAISTSAGTIGGGGGGKESKLCAQKVFQVLGDLVDTKLFDYNDVYNKFTKDVQWQVKPALWDESKKEIYAPIISKAGQVVTDPTTAFYGNKGLIQINSNSNLMEYCSLDSSKNDEVILHEVFRGVGLNDEVFNLSIPALKNSSARKARIQPKRYSIYEEAGISQEPYIAPLYTAISEKEVQVNLDTLGDGNLIVAVNPGPYLVDPSDNSYQKYFWNGIGKVVDLTDRPTIGQVAAANALLICQGLGFSKVSFMEKGWNRIGTWMNFDKKIKVPDVIGYVREDGTISVGNAGNGSFCAGRGFFGECGNNTWGEAYSFFTKLRCRK